MSKVKAIRIALEVGGEKGKVSMIIGVFVIEEEGGEAVQV